VGRRLLPVALLVASLAAVPSAQPAYGGHVLGPQRILVALVTWGPKPVARDEVRTIFDQVEAFYSRSSYGKVSLTGDVTPWLDAFDVPVACNLPVVRSDGSAAALAAGYDPARYDRVVFVHPEQNCPWSGVTQAATVYLNGAVTPYLVAHELGHSFGLSHSNLTDCTRHGCGALEYGDPYDTMGVGDLGDFNAKDKYDLGWITNVTRPAKNGTYALGAIESKSTLPQGFVVTTANDQYWIEYRSRPGKTYDGRGEAGAGVILRVSPSPDLTDFGSSGIPNLLLSNPNGRHRPDLHGGERFVYPGAFTLTVLSTTPSRARLRFRWTDATAPRTPRFDAALVGGRVQVTLDSAHESGSGVARYAITLDQRAPRSIGGDMTEEPVQMGKPLPGTHTVTVVVVDRAGNRSRPAVRHLKVP
jgi:gametolysin peptidase M11